MFLNLLEPTMQLMLTILGNSEAMIMKANSLILSRDGVTDGQFAQVKEQEIEKMTTAFDRITAKYDLRTTYRPTITFIIVQKRHHTRLKPVDSEDADGKAKNVPFGTLVTQKIVNTNGGEDFFLCSHQSSQGTSKPSHYYVLVDENKFKAGDLYRLTFGLCHTYVKCTKVISIPAPVQYAHLAAFRARQHLGNIEKTWEKERRRSYDDPDRERKEIEKYIRIHDRLKSDFYFI